MQKRISKKTKLLFVLLTGSMLFIYQKFFGGKIQTLTEKETTTDEPQKEVPPTTEQKTEEKVAVTYAETPTKGVQEVVKRTGNLDFIKPGQKVLIKPNINSDDPAPGTTHPEALAEVIRLAKSKGAYVIVGDRSNPHWKTISAMKKTGMYQAAEEAGADEIVGFEDGEWIRVNPESESNWPRGFRIPKILEEIDHIISIPVLHTHSITSHSLALKNLVGLVHPNDRMIFHASAKRDEMISEISLVIKPAITIIDGTKSFIDGGPSLGTVSESKVYLASRDILAADIVGIELLKKENAKLFWDDPWESRQVKRAVELGLGTITKDGIQSELERNGL